MKKRLVRVAYTVMLLFVFVCATGCSVPWGRKGNAAEEVTPPETSTVAGAISAKPTEPPADAVYERYAAVRIDAVAAIRLYVDVRKQQPIIVSVQALNAKAKEALADWDPQDMVYEEAVSALSESLLEKGIVNAFHTRVAIELEQNGPSKKAAESLTDTAQGIITDIYAKHGLEAVFDDENVSVGE